MQYVWHRFQTLLCHTADITTEHIKVSWNCNQVYVEVLQLVELRLTQSVVIRYQNNEMRILMNYIQTYNGAYIIWRLLSSGMWLAVVWYIISVSGGTCCLHLQGTFHSSILNIEETDFSKMLIMFYHNAWRHIPENGNLYSHCCENTQILHM